MKGEYPHSSPSSAIRRNLAQQRGDPAHRHAPVALFRRLCLHLQDRLAILNDEVLRRDA